ncbi:MAG: flagellar motor protein MotB [Eubacteriales bacterium]|nr:flagellar motor protein MotB [Eubacteriales bacterium]
MAKRREEIPPAGSPAWMATFSDLMNLLLCFFVLLFSMSTVDAQKFQEVAASLASSFSILPSGGSALSDEGILVSSGASQLNDLSDFYNNMGLNMDGEFNESINSAIEEVEKEGLEQSEKMAEKIEAHLEAANVADMVEVTATSKYVMLNLNGGVLFDSGSADIKSDALSLLNAVSDSIYEYKDHIITVEGHTDNVPISTSQYPDNMMLSLYRAYSVFDYFVQEKGFDEKTISSSGRGEAVPISSNSSADGRAQNRRVEIKIYNSLNS